VLGDRLIEVQYESLVANAEIETRNLLQKLGLGFEQSCLDFEQNTSASASASSVQVREKIHQRSIEKWKNFELQLTSLKARLEQGGIKVE
jgi:hypothetical protein